MIVRSTALAGIRAVLQATKPAAVLLDLDLPDATAWEMAELLLSQSTCPPLILLTDRAERFDLRTPMATGALVGKSEPGGCLVELVEEVLRMPPAARAERTASQRALIRWMRPYEMTLLEGTVGHNG